MEQPAPYTATSPVRYSAELEFSRPTANARDAGRMRAAPSQKRTVHPTDCRLQMRHEEHTANALQRALVLKAERGGIFSPRRARRMRSMLKVGAAYSVVSRSWCSR